LVGGDNFELQTKQALENIKIALASENATFNDVIKLNIYMVDGCDPAIGLKHLWKRLASLKSLLDNGSRGCRSCQSFVFD